MTMREFSYEEVEAATGGFAAKNLVGKGSHGSVYRARLVTTRGGGGRMAVVAVKRPSHAQGEAKLTNEIAVLSAAPRHPGVIGIVGVSSSSSPPQPADTAASGPRLPPLLVMEFMPNGSLHDLLHRSPRPPPWPRRVEIALDVARAVQALHAAAPRVIHRDVKSANVLLGRDGRARLADFSLAVCVKATVVHAPPPGARASGGGGGEEEEQQQEDADEEGSASAKPAPAGTIGYLDPCYTEPGRLGPASDVFSFGVVLLELVSGRKVMDVNSCPSSIVSWAAPLIAAGRAREVLDARVAAPPTARAGRAVARVLSLAARCVSESVERRPAMDEVVSELRGALESAGWWRWRRRHHGDTVVERVCRRVASWGQRVRRRSKRVVRATKVECTEHSTDSGVPPAPAPDPSSRAADLPLPSHRSIMSGGAAVAHLNESKAKENAALVRFESELDLVFTTS